jgi:hypothetical protein
MRAQLIVKTRRIDAMFETLAVANQIQLNENATASYK